jgi:hypothetical protein
MEAAIVQTKQVNTDVPFGQPILVWSEISDARLNKMVERSHLFDSHYLAWETVRLGLNPFFVKGTGFEGYLIGVCESPAQTIEVIMTYCQNMLDRIARLYRHEYTFRSRLIKTLCRESDDPRAMNEWSAQLGATLAQLRCNLDHNLEAQKFQSQTYRIVHNLPPIHYWEDKDATLLKQSYAFSAPLDNRKVLLIDSRNITPAHQDAWMVAEAIGEFGHPLVREYLRAQNHVGLYH